MRGSVRYTLMIVAVIAGAAAAGPAGGQVTTRCKSDQLRVRSDYSFSGSGNRGVVYVLRNRGRSCSTRGYPRVSFANARGRTLSVRPRRRTKDYWGPLRLRRVTIGAGGVASFRLTSTTGAGACYRARRFRVTPPGGTSALKVRVNYSVCKKRVTVSPIQRGYGARSVR